MNLLILIVLAEYFLRFFYMQDRVIGKQKLCYFFSNLDTFLFIFIDFLIAHAGTSNTVLNGSDKSGDPNLPHDVGSKAVVYHQVQCYMGFWLFQ